MSFSGVTFVSFCFVFVFMLSLKPRPFVQSSFDMATPIATHVSFFFFLSFIWRCRFFRVFFVPLPFSLCMESTSYVLSFRMVFFYLVTTGWIFDISLCENSIITKKKMATTVQLCDLFISTSLHSILRTASRCIILIVHTGSVINTL